MSDQNSPSSLLPKLPRLLRRFKKSPPFAHRHRPRLPIRAKEVKKLRVTTKTTALGSWVYPEFRVGHTWYQFYDVDSAMAVYFPRGISRVREAADDWEDWLEDWIDDNHTKAKLYEEKIAAVIENVERKTRKRCGFCKKKRHKLYLDKNSKLPICSYCVETMSEDQRVVSRELADSVFEDELDRG